MYSVIHQLLFVYKSRCLFYFIRNNTLSPTILKELGGRRVVIVLILLYTDDTGTSGNRSKKWNKFDCWCFLMAGLHRYENARLYNIHFITCTNNEDATDIRDPIVRELKHLEEGIPAYYAYMKKEVLVVAPVMAFLCDNPRHSQLLQHSGGNAN